jgi:hypothetical protein
MSRRGRQGGAWLREAEVCGDADPDGYERSEHPEQKCRLGDRKPWELLALQEEPRPLRSAAVNVQLDDLSAHRFGGIAGRLAVAVAKEDRPGGPLGRHRASLARRHHPARGRQERRHR